MKLYLSLNLNLRSNLTRLQFLTTCYFNILIGHLCIDHIEKTFVKIEDP